jgi:2-succinyl-5-enolpyruvyl-6-hydroxy-3-cyclohexene-1-carboxylate synthase
MTLSFARHPKFKTHSISDERSAAFIALGMAEAQKKPVALVCTSGTATLNFAPAIAEAHYRDIPLLVLTADRPPEWIDQWDGQTIRQQNLYQNFICACYQLSDNYTHPDQIWQIYRTLNEALILCPKGPVHINVPLREPFYPKPDQKLQYSENLPFFKSIKSEKKLSAQSLESLQNQAETFSKILIVKGQDPKHSLDLPPSIPFVADVISNPETQSIAHHDLFLGKKNLDFESLRPQLLITYGKSLVSKNLKLFLRKHPPKQHWHVGSNYADVFQCLSHIVEVEPQDFFPQIKWKSLDLSYFNLWQTLETQTANGLTELDSDRFQDSSFLLVREFLADLREVDLHLANSMSVRYANFFGVHTSVKVFANRGTSGIDGSTSTVVGHCFAKPSRKQVFITGDVSFFYDRNAFWNELPKSNLLILLLNDQGGSIFGMIEGPAQQREAQEFFITRQSLQAQNLCQEYGLKYFRIQNIEAFRQIKAQLYDSEVCTVVEFLTESSLQAQHFKAIKDYLHTKLPRTLH